MITAGITAVFDDFLQENHDYCRNLELKGYFLGYDRDGKGSITILHIAIMVSNFLH